MLQEPTDDSMSTLMDSYGPAFFGGHLHASFEASNDSLHSHLEVFHLDVLPLSAGCMDGRLVAHILDIGPSEARTETGNFVGDILFLELGEDLLQVHHEDFLPSLDVRIREVDVPVEPPRPRQRVVEDILPVGCCKHHNILVGAEAVHLDQQLVKGVVTLTTSPESWALAHQTYMNAVCR